MRKFLVTFFALGIAVMLLPSAWAATATPLPSGGTVTPVPVSTGLPSSGLLASTTSAVTNGGAVSANITEDVYNVGGTLDFFIQVANTGTDALESVETDSFLGFTTSVAQDPGANAFSEVEASNASRDGTSGTNGDAVRFGFTNTGGQLTQIGPGQTSYWLEIDTNATTYGVGEVSVQDGGVASAVKFFAPTPEPATTGIIGGALALMALVGRRRLAKKA